MLLIAVEGVVWVGWVNPLKKENLSQKSFSDVGWRSGNLWKMISPDVKANLKRKEIKKLVAAL